MDLLACQLGADPQGQVRVLAALRATLREGAGDSYASTMSAREAVGFSADQLSDLDRRFNFGTLQAHFPERGSRSLLRRIAWFGSALADVACPTVGESRHETMEMGALFNLAVALFDSVVDGRPRLKRSLFRALEVPKMVARLRGPNDEATRIRSAEHPLAPLCMLFDAVLRSLGQRYAGSNSRLSDIERQLERMHSSETLPGRKRIEAKCLPVTFVCQASDTHAPMSVRKLYIELGRLLALLDDWRDIADDVRAGRANQFICSYDFGGPHMMNYALGVMSGLLRGTARGAEAFERELVPLLGTILDLARHLPSLRSQKLQWLLGQLLGPT